MSHIKAGQGTGHAWDTLVPGTPNNKTQPGTLKALARQVLNSVVPLSRTVEVGHVGQELFQSRKSGTSLGHKWEDVELFESMKRLEASRVCITIFEDGAMRVVTSSKREAVGRNDAGGTIYSPVDMYHYIHLEPHERRMLHEFKKRFGGTVEWKPQ